MTTPSSLEARVAHVEGIVEEMRSRLTSIEDRVTRIEERVQGLEKRMNEGFRDLDQKISAVELRLTEKMNELERGMNVRMQANFQWMLGILLPMWITIILAILLRT